MTFFLWILGIILFLGIVIYVAAEHDLGDE
jgi:hypothetical protein